MYFNERLVGRGVAAAIASGAVARSDLFIATKLMPSEMHPERVAALVDDSLAALATPYIDLFMLHWPYQIAFQPKSFPVPMDERMGYSIANVRAVWRALEAQVALGKIRSLGVSNFSCTRLTDSLLAADAEFKVASPPVCNQLEVHAYLSQARQCEWHARRGIIVTTYCPLGSPARPPTCRHEDEDDEKDASSPFVELLQHPTVAAVAARTQRSAAQVLLRWALQRGTVPLPKTVTPARAEQNALVYGWALSADDMAAIDALHCDRRFIRGDNHCAAGEAWQGTWAEGDGVL
jgi:diketogulonate reductase-like aldo/keto reductase